MSLKHSEHRALLIRAQMKGTVPAKNTVETSAKIEAAHISGVPCRIWHFRARSRNQVSSAINTRDLCALLVQIARNGFARTASKIQDMRFVRQLVQELIEPRFFKQCLRAQRDPFMPMAVVTVDDLIILRGHVPNLTSHDANEKRPPKGDLLIVSGMEADLAIQQS
jgi:hypothetical protein